MDERTRIKLRNDLRILTSDIGDRFVEFNKKYLEENPFDPVVLDEDVKQDLYEINGDMINVIKQMCRLWLIKLEGAEDE